jgi:hypothetical protein
MRARLLTVLLVLVAAPAAMAGVHPEPGDVDGDYARDEVDNCRVDYNPDQSDIDGDRIGDRCDPDFDPDGDGFGDTRYASPRDNCPSFANPAQTDANGNGFGDECEVDTDGDSVYDVFDNCPSTGNRAQSDIDLDTQGDACDGDRDADFAANAADNCPDIYNPDQLDADRDGRGRLCDADEEIREELGGGGGGSGPGSGGTTGDGPGAASRDQTRPRLTLRVASTQRFAELGSGLIVRLRCSEACAATAELMLAGRRRVLASGSAQLERAGTTFAFVRFAARARRVLFARSRVRVTLRVTAVDRAENRRVITRRLTLRR